MTTCHVHCRSRWRSKSQQRDATGPTMIRASLRPDGKSSYCGAFDFTLFHCAPPPTPLKASAFRPRGSSPSSHRPSSSLDQRPGATGVGVESAPAPSSASACPGPRQAGLPLGHDHPPSRLAMITLLPPVRPRRRRKPRWLAADNFGWQCFVHRRRFARGVCSSAI